MKYAINNFIVHHPHLFHSLLVRAHLHDSPIHIGSSLGLNVLGKLLFSKNLLKSISKTKLAMACSIIFLIPTMVLIGMFVRPQTVSYSYETENCVLSPVILPNNVNVTGSDNIIYTQKTKLSVFGYPLLSTTSCAKLSSLPENASETIKLNSPILLSKTISVNIEEPPKPKIAESLNSSVSPKANIVFNLDQTDKTFGYVLDINDQSLDCFKQEMSISCDLSLVNLDQGESYDYRLNQTLGGEFDVALEDEINILEPTQIIESSLQPDQIIYTKTLNATFRTNNPIKDADVQLLQENDQIEIAIESSDNTMSITSISPLARGKQFTLKINDIVGDNGSYLAEPYEAKFISSTGPKVISANIGTYKVNLDKTIRIDFDVELDPNQDIASFVSFNFSNTDVPSNISSSGNSIYINPVDNLPRCTPFSVSISDGFASIYGISGDSAWSYNSRTICQNVFSIGNSVKGSSLLAYSFGSGPNKVLFVGGMHGNEKSTVRTLNAFIDDLERRYGEIPADKTIVVIPNTNPDGYAISSRTNANNVDLNRNFPANDWATDVYQPRNVLHVGGGGSGPLSEPESSALASYIQSNSPTLVLTYHAVASVVFSNGSGNSTDLANEYGNLAGFASYEASFEDGIFDYPTTGEFETWLHDKLGIPALLVENRTLGSNEYSRQKSAIWMMIK